MIIFWKNLACEEWRWLEENDNKLEPEDASQDNVDDFNEDTCEVCLYDVENVGHSTENIISELMVFHFLG